MTAPAPAPYDFLAIGANASGGFHLYVTDANGRKIAAVWGPAAEKEATARLFAGAPELLAAAKAACETGDRHKLNALRAAIALCEAQP